MRLNKLSINNCKSSCLLTSKSLRKTDNKTGQFSFQIRLNGVSLIQTPYANNLAVVTDTKLDWSSVKSVRTKFSRVYSFIIENSKFCFYCRYRNFLL